MEFRWLPGTTPLYELPPAEYRAYVAQQAAMLVGLLAHVVFLPLFVVLGFPVLALFNLLSITVFVIAVRLNRSGRQKTAITLTASEVVVHGVLATLVAGWQYGFQQYLFVVAPGFLLYPHWRTSEKAVGLLGPVAAYAVIYVTHGPATLLDTSWSGLTSAVGVTNMVITMLVLALFMFFYSSAAWSTERKLLDIQRKLEAAARTDALTNLMNRRAILEELDKEFSRFGRGHGGFSIALCDVDDFKRINDMYGHDAGDAVLQHLAKIMLQNLRQYDSPGRWGGEEFLILLPETQHRTALATIEQLREAVELQPIVHRGRTIRITLTAGVSCARPGVVAADLLREADQALLAGKKSGKNRSVLAPTCTGL